MVLQQWLGELSKRAKTGVKNGRRRAARGSLPLTVAEAMTRDVGTTRIDDMLSQPASIMWERDCGIVPVMDGGERVLGVVTDRDICMAALTQGQPLQAIAVSTAMSRTLIAVGSSETLDVAEALMGEHQVRRLPVIDDGRLVGMLSVGDLLRCVAAETTDHTRGTHRRRSLGRGTHGRRAHVVGAARERLLRALSDICQPRPSEASSA